MNDEQMTLTIVELDMLRKDYEAEHTVTQHASQALRDAVADPSKPLKQRAPRLPQQPRWSYRTRRRPKRPTARQTCRLHASG